MSMWAVGVQGSEIDGKQDIAGDGIEMAGMFDIRN